jgi:hypothetical protein
MPFDPIHAFYCRKEYLGLSQRMKMESGGKCAMCGRIFPLSELRTHHITELTIDNVDNVAVALNPDNIIVICHDCHNEVHNRFGSAKTKQVYIVHGAPCAGKTSYVQQVATRNDLILDFDRIHQAICCCSLYDKPDATKGIAFDIRDLMLDRIKTRTGKWHNAYIIGCYPSNYDRERLAVEYKAQLIHIDTSKEECIMRCRSSIERSTICDAYVGYIEDYFRKFTQ